MRCFQGWCMALSLSVHTILSRCGGGLALSGELALTEVDSARIEVPGNRSVGSPAKSWAVQHKRKSTGVLGEWLTCEIREGGLPWPRGGAGCGLGPGGPADWPRAGPGLSRAAGPKASRGLSRTAAHARVSRSQADSFVQRFRGVGRRPARPAGRCRGPLPRPAGRRRRGRAHDLQSPALRPGPQAGAGSGNLGAPLRKARCKN